MKNINYRSYAVVIITMYYDTALLWESRRPIMRSISYTNFKVEN